MELLIWVYLLIVVFSIDIVLFYEYKTRKLKNKNIDPVLIFHGIRSKKKGVIYYGDTKQILEFEVFKEGYTELTLKHNDKVLQKQRIYS